MNLGGCMFSIILRRVAVSVPLLLAVSFLTFALVSLTPGDVATTILGTRATPAELEALRVQLGLNRPLPIQYGAWLSAALHGDLGNSLLNGQPVTEAIGQRLGPTLSLVIFAMILIVLVGVPLGLMSAVRGGGLTSAINAASYVGVAIPNFVLALILIPIFAVSLRLLPPSGYVPPDVSVSGWMLSLVLPVMAMAFGAVGIIAKQTRAAVKDVMAREFIIVLRANGYRRRSIIWKHLLKAAAVPIVAYLGIIMVNLFGATVLMETIFAVPGLGGLAVQASSQADLPMVIGVTVVFTLIVVIINLGLDVIYAVVNPKVSFR